MSFMHHLANTECLQHTYELLNLSLSHAALVLVAGVGKQSRKDQIISNASAQGGPGIPP